ncbi:dTDP-glucose 4,6-dehydratase [Thermopetrobacter sp. TC1]|uniref:dTDP-glucose 4,6-dehydratase n=1 Tax=Thermopetrobacter sp. TC1 TaxID=1495045 RepID=UPI0005710F0A|nr:dTDP-glucose 4,6-dehydratase [Thermopetrobacter sp. TC1]
MRVLVTGGCGFIGANLCLYLVREAGCHVLNVDALTYAANPASLRPIADHARYRFLRADIADAGAMRQAIAAFAPDIIIHLAAESHVDRSITDAAPFLRTNVIGTHVLLQAATAYWQALPPERQCHFRFLHVSTDEVFGDLSLQEERAFSEQSPYAPSSPYAASKAAADHLVRAWHRTYGLPILITNCSNNYGPRQFPEKLIPRMIINALLGRPLPVYGRGENVRDWLHVEDHVRALFRVAQKGRPGRTYCIGGRCERSNIDLVRTLCRMLDEMRPAGTPHERRITFMPDRPGHDRRYAIDPTRIETELGWRPRLNFDDGLRQTVRWYLNNEDWWRPLLKRAAARGEGGILYEDGTGD